jgi:hypothetical protein
MPQSIEDLVTFEVIPLVRTALKETAELTGAVQVLTQRVEELTTELVEGEVKELRRLTAIALRIRRTVEEGDVR